MDIYYDDLNPESDYDIEVKKVNPLELKEDGIIVVSNPNAAGFPSESISVKKLKEAMLMQAKSRRQLPSTTKKPTLPKHWHSKTHWIQHNDHWHSLTHELINTKRWHAEHPDINGCGFSTHTTKLTNSSEGVQNKNKKIKENKQDNNKDTLNEKGSDKISSEETSNAVSSEEDSDESSSQDPSGKIPSSNKKSNKKRNKKHDKSRNKKRKIKLDHHHESDVSSIEDDIGIDISKETIHISEDPNTTEATIITTTIPNRKTDSNFDVLKALMIQFKEFLKSNSSNFNSSILNQT